MSYAPIAAIIPQYDEQTGFYLKFYIPSTTTPIAIATDSTGATLLAKCQLDNDGFPTTDGTQLFIPHINARYDAYLFPSAALADNNDTTNAKRVASNNAPQEQFAGTYNAGSISDAITVDLNDYSLVVTRYGLEDGDKFGGVFSKTGVVDISKAGTIDINNGNLYDLNGNEFQITGKKIRLETLGVPYDEISGTVLNYIAELRSNDYSVDVSDRYNISNYDSSKGLYNNQHEIIVHRSFQDQAPENTLLALSLVANSCAGQNIAIEIDLQISSDGVPVVFHDLSVDTLTDGTGEVINLTLAELKALQFNSVIGTAFEGVGGVTIPTFDEYMRLISQYGFKVYPEIKKIRTNADIDIINNVVKKYRWQSSTVYTSFRMSDLEYLRTINQQSGISLVFEDGYSTDTLKKLQQMGKATVFQSINTWIENPTDIDVFASYGIDSIPYTADRIESFYNTTDLGLQKVITDRNFLPMAGLTATTSPCRFDLSPWAQIQTGSSTITFKTNPENGQSAGEIVECEGAAGEDCRVRLGFNATASEIIKLTVFARNIGSHTDEASIDIDRNFGSRKNTINIRSTDWMLYEIAYQAPFNDTFAAYQGGFDLGVNTTRDAGAAFYRPTIYTNNSAYGSSRVIMSGLLVLAKDNIAGNHVLEKSTNVDTVSNASISGLLDIRPQKESQLIVDVFDQYPESSVSVSITNQDTNPIQINGDSRFSTGNLRISATNLLNGSQIDLSTYNVEHRVYFEVKM